MKAVCFLTCFLVSTEGRIAPGRRDCGEQPRGRPVPGRGEREVARALPPEPRNLGDMCATPPPALPACAGECPP